MDGDDFAMFYLKGGVLIAVDAVNRPREFMACRKLVPERPSSTRRACASRFRCGDDLTDGEDHLVQPDGTAATVEVPNGLSVMEGAIEHDIAGVIAECG